MKNSRKVMQAHGTLLLEATYCTAGQAGSVPCSCCLCGLQQGFGKAKVPFTQAYCPWLGQLLLKLARMQANSHEQKREGTTQAVQNHPIRNAVPLACWRGGWPLAAACTGCMLAYYSIMQGRYAVRLVAGRLVHMLVSCVPDATQLIFSDHLSVVAIN